MKKTNLFYWITTSLFCLLMLGSAIPNIIGDPISVKGVHEELGYPVYIIPFLGVAKALGALVLLLPRFPRLKEWAYAGLFFDLLGAQYSILAIGKPDWIFLFLPLACCIGSYFLYHRRLQARKQAGSGLPVFPAVAA